MSSWRAAVGSPKGGTGEGSSGAPSPAEPSAPGPPDAREVVGGESEIDTGSLDEEIAPDEALAYCEAHHDHESIEAVFACANTRANSSGHSSERTAAASDDGADGPR